MASVCATVTTPVPPMPVMRIPNSVVGTRNSGSGSSSAASVGSVSREVRGASPGTTVTNEGQLPLRQE